MGFRSSTEGEDRHTGDDNVVDIFRSSPLCQVIVDTLDVVDIQEASLGTTEQSGIILDGIPLRWGVDDAEHFLEMVV